MSYFSFAAAVAVTNHDGSLSIPGIYTIQVPTLDGQPLSGDDAVVSIARNLWMVMGDKIVAAEAVQEAGHMANFPKLQPLRYEDWFAPRDDPIFLKTNLYDPNHPDYRELDKCITPARERTAWKVRSLDRPFSQLVAQSALSSPFQFHKHASEGRQGFLLRQDGRLLPYPHVYDHMRGSRTQPKGLGLGTSGFLNGSDRYDVHHNDSLGVNPMDVMGPPPSYEPEEDLSSESEEELYTDFEPEVEKKPIHRARNAGNRMKREALGASVKTSSSRRARLPSRDLKKAATRIIARRNLLSKRIPRVPSTKKAAVPARRPPASRSTTASPKKLPVAAPSPKKPTSSVAPLSLPVSAPLPGQTSPVRCTRAAVRQGVMSLPSITPPLPERRIVAPRSTQALVVPQANDASQTAVNSRRLPAYSPPESQPVAGPSRIPMEEVPRVEAGGYQLRPRGPRRSGWE